MIDISELPGHLIRRLQQISVAIFAGHMTDAGLDLTPVQFAALATLEANPGIDQATLAGLIFYDRVTLGGVVDRLLSKGLITRTISPNDRRARVLTLSPQGQQVLDLAAPAVMQVQDAILQGLAPSERKTFIRLARKAMNARNRADPPSSTVPLGMTGSASCRSPCFTPPNRTLRA